MEVKFINVIFKMNACYDDLINSSFSDVLVMYTFTNEIRCDIYGTTTVSDFKQFLIDNKISFKVTSPDMLPTQILFYSDDQYVVHYNSELDSEYNRNRIKQMEVLKSV